MVAIYLLPESRCATWLSQSLLIRLLLSVFGGEYCRCLCQLSRRAFVVILALIAHSTLCKNLHDSHHHRSRIVTVPMLVHTYDVTWVLLSAVVNNSIQNLHLLYMYLSPALCLWCVLVSVLRSLLISGYVTD